MAQKNRVYSHLSFPKTLKITFNKVITLIFLSTLLFLGFWITYEIRETAKDLEMLQMEQGRLSARYKDFTTRVDEIKARSHMEKLGEKMGLHPPADGQIIFLK